MTIANRRHHDLLVRRGERLSPDEFVMSLLLLVAGMPTRKRSAASSTPQILSQRREAA